MNSSPYFRTEFKLLIISAAFFLSSCNSYNSSLSTVSSDGKGNYISVSSPRLSSGGLVLHSQDSSSLIDKDALPLMAPMKDAGGSLIYLKQSSDSKIGIYSETNREKPLAELRVSPYNLDVKTGSGKILFSCFMPGYFSLSHKYYIYDITSGNLTELEIPDMSYPYTLNISEDGKKLLFSRGRGITVRDIASSQEKTYCADIDFGSIPKFIAMSADSSFICFRAGRVKNMNINSRDNDFTNVDPFNVRYDLVNKRGLYLLNLKDKTISTLKISEEAAAYPAFSPDSGKLAFIQGTGLAVYEIKSGTLKEFSPWMLNGTFKLTRSLFWLDNETVAVSMNNGQSDALMICGKTETSLKILPLSK